MTRRIASVVRLQTVQQCLAINSDRSPDVLLRRPASLVVRKTIVFTDDEAQGATDAWAVVTASPA